MVAGVLLILAGLFTMAGSMLNWNWFFNSSRARLIVAIFGRQGARIVYGILGILIIIFGILAMISA